MIFITLQWSISYASFEDQNERNDGQLKETLNQGIACLACGYIVAEPRQSGVLRSGNIPAGDLAESLFCQAFSWDKEPNSNKGFDATDGRVKSTRSKAAGYIKKKKGTVNYHSSATFQVLIYWLVFSLMKNMRNIYLFPHPQISADFLVLPKL